ncbi:hypothetical protein ACHAWF_018882 [Thalassiosira exigua]
MDRLGGSAPPPPATTSATVTKTIHLIRHGVALHNVPDARTGERPNLLDPALTDPPLVSQGELQARHLGEQLRRKGVVEGAGGGGGGGDGRDGADAALGSDKGVSGGPGHGQRPIELVVCSPLTRCLQTASLVFPSHFEGSDAVPSSVEVGSGSTVRIDNGSQVHVLDRTCRVCCHGDVREAYGMHYPDKRSPLSRLKSQFPTVTYHPALAETDVDWRTDARETRHDVSRRVRDFFCWLMMQPHESIAVVTHGVWMECALLDHFPAALNFGKKRVYNCEVYHGKLVGVTSDNDAGNTGSGGVALQDVEQMSFHYV